MKDIGVEVLNKFSFSYSSFSEEINEFKLRRIDSFCQDFDFLLSVVEFHSINGL
jgi:hypothetical protein